MRDPSLELEKLASFPKEVLLLPQGLSLAALGMILSAQDPNVPTHLPKWTKKTLSSTELDVGNPVDPRRTQSDFQRAGIALSCHDSLLLET